MKPLLAQTGKTHDLPLAIVEMIDDGVFARAGFDQEEEWFNFAIVFAVCGFIAGGVGGVPIGEEDFANLIGHSYSLV